MLSPHNNVAILSRGKNQSALAAAAYRHATQMGFISGEITESYAWKQNELQHSQISIPQNLPSWAETCFGSSAFVNVCEHIQYDEAQQEKELSHFAIERQAWAVLSERLWQSVEMGEDNLNKRKKTAQLARSVTIAIPNVLSRDHQIELIEGYIGEAFTSHGMVADWVIHDTGTGNPHAHILLTLRTLGEDDWHHKKPREWNSVAVLRQQRALWATHANAMLEREGFDERIDHRKLKDQQIELGAKAVIEPENWNIHPSKMSLDNGDASQDREKYERTKARNRAKLREDPAHILIMVQMAYATFTGEDVRAEFTRRLKDHADEEEINHLTEVAMQSTDLLPVLGKKKGHNQCYITAGKAKLTQQVSRDARRLSVSQLEQTWLPADEKVRPDVAAANGDINDIVSMTPAETHQSITDEKNALTLPVDALETGDETILIDVAAYDECQPEQEKATPKPIELVAEMPQKQKDEKPAFITQKLSADVVREALLSRAENLFRQAVGQPVRAAGQEWRAKSNAAFSMQMQGPKRGLWRDHSAGEGGDLFDFFAQHYLGLSSARKNFPKVLEQAASFCGIRAGELQPDQEAINRLKERQQQRTHNAQVAEQHENARRVELVQQIQSLSADVVSSEQAVALDSGGVVDSPATRYLKTRGIRLVPPTGLSWLAGDTLASSSKGLVGRQYDALVVWAYDQTGGIVGGQRILVHHDGSKADTDIRKPSFGHISGAIAKFPARLETHQVGPLIIAEGPESALSIWQATGHETWAVFGVSGWRNAPIPTDRDVVLAPDRDAPSSPAGRAFRKALAHHVARGCQIKVAYAPEAVGSKKDLNDTHLRAGEQSVRDAIDAARDVRPWLSLDLNASQRHAAEAMLGPERLTLVTGYAGSGKTFTLAEVARVWQERGVEVLAGAPSGKATQELSALKGVHVATLAAWESRWARGETPQSTYEGKPFVFLMDEAGMVGSRQWARLQSRVGAMGGKLVAIGDPEQLQPVKEISGWVLAERSVRKTGSDIPVINVVKRQVSQADRQATMALARGDQASIQSALSHYMDQGDILFDVHSPVEDIAREYVGGLMSESSAMNFSSRVALAATNNDVALLNAAIRAEAVKHGFVKQEGMQEFPVEWLERCVDSDGMDTVERHEAMLAVGIGDRIMLTHPHIEEGLPRSSFGTVTDVDRGGFWLQIDGRDRLAYIDAAANPQFAYGYAATVHKSQGMTVDEAFVLLHRSMDRYAINVALTRHRHHVTLYGQAEHCESLEELERIASRRERPLRGLPLVNDMSMVPLPNRDEVLSRPDWVHARFDQPKGSMLADRQIMAVATRVAGLLSADFADTDPLLADVDGEPHDYTQAPRRVIDDLVARHGVIFAEEIAGVIARQVRDPETFLRLLKEALDHHDLVRLPRSAGRPGETEQRVFTTATHLSAEIAAVDRGLLMAVGGRDDHMQHKVDFNADNSTSGDVINDLTLSDAQQNALHILVERVTKTSDQERGKLDIVEGRTGSGKTRLASCLTQSLKRQGRRVVVVSPTEAGRQALRGEGVDAVTLGMYLSEPVMASGKPDDQKVVILDDAHGLGIGQADSLLMRIGAEGSRLVAMVHPDRRPARAGPVFQRIAERLRMYKDLEGEVIDFNTVLDLDGYFGPETPLLHTLGVSLSAPHVASADMQSVFNDAIAAGMVIAGGSVKQSIKKVAQQYVADKTFDKMALTWSRKDADALTTAIRHELDATYPARRSNSLPDHGPCQGLKPGDYIRFIQTGFIEQGVRRGVTEDDLTIRRGDMGVVKAIEEGVIRFDIFSANHSAAREITITQDGPLPDWSFAFASTIMASAGRRHESVHLLANSKMDRQIVSTGVAVAKKALKVTVPVTEDRLDATLEEMGRRSRLARSGLDHGFDPSETMRMARDQSVLDISTSDVNAVSVKEYKSLDEGVGVSSALPKIALSHVQLQRANQRYLKANPEHVLTLLAFNQAVFTESDIRLTLRDKTGYILSETDVTKLTRQILQSPDLVPLSRRSPDGSRQYITRARAEQLNDISTDAEHLKVDHFEPGDGPVVRPHKLDELNTAQALAADAMLNAQRLTMVTGRAGTGKTFTLKAVAREWRARGVKVLAGAPSGKATAELKGIRGVQAQTLATWESRWARGEVPTEPFVFIMDEAGMIGSGQWGRIQAKVRALGGKLIAVGDPDQLQPISDIPAWGLAERAAGGSVMLDTVVRQAEVQHRLATEMLARGGEHIPHAIQSYDAVGAIHISAEVLADPVRALARDFVAQEEQVAKMQIALGYSNRDVAALNDTIRAMRRQKAASVHHTDDIPAGGFDLTTERDYGMIIRTFADHDGLHRVYHVKRLFAVGDRVMTTEALPDRDVAKSSFGTVMATHQDSIDVQFDGDTHAVTLTQNELYSLDYGYAATIHKSQGLSADHVFVLPHRRMHRHATYVALSRHRDTVSVYGRVGHMENLADLIRLGQASGHLDMDPEEIDRLASRTSAKGMVPHVSETGLGNRADWVASLGGADHLDGRSSFIGDMQAMAVAERVAGLMASKSQKDEQLVPDGLSDAQRRYLSEPTRVIDDVMKRSSVIRADDIADKLSAVVTDPETFMRLFTQALRHADLVKLGEADEQGNPVYSTKTQLQKEVHAVDVGTTLAMVGASEGAPRATLNDLMRRDWRTRLRVEQELSDDVRRAVDLAMEPGRLRFIRGAPGAGKTKAAVELARLHEMAGWTVITVAPTGAGLSALESDGAVKPMTVKRFLTQTKQNTDGQTNNSASMDMDEKTVVILDDATRLGGEEATAILERVKASGAKFVAMLGGEEQTPLGAGPVMRTLEMRVGSIQIGQNESHHSRRALILDYILKGEKHADDLLQTFQEGDTLVVGGDARRAISVLADGYLKDLSDDKIALTWSRSDAEAVTKAIRAKLDKTIVERHVLRPRTGNVNDDLRVGDRLRFLASTPYRPLRQRTREWSARRLLAGERAEVIAMNQKTHALTLRVTERNGSSTRDVVIPAQHHADIPRWTFAFAGTIHGEGALVRDSVHLLASHGMTRQVLAAGIAAHRENLTITVPSAENRMEEVLGRIVRRNGRAESALDYGFDPTLGARAALETSFDNRSKDGVFPAAEKTKRSGIRSALERIAHLAGLNRSSERDPLPSHAVHHVLAEVTGASLAAKGNGTVDIDVRDQKALEHFVRRLSHRREWRRLLRQVPGNLPRDADALAEKYAGIAQGDRRSLSPQHELSMTVARYLARGALTARSLGEERVAQIFEIALQRFGVRADTARLAGHPETWGAQDEVANIDAKASHIEREAIDPVVAQDDVQQDQRTGAESDSTYDARALQLAVTINERVDANHPVHKRDLIADIKMLLKEADDMSTANPERCAELEHDIVQQRVTADTKQHLARQIVANPPDDIQPGRFYEEIFTKNIGYRNRSQDHPLELHHTAIQREYDIRVDREVRQALSQKIKPTDTEKAVTRMVANSDLTTGRDDLVDALTLIFREGSLQSVDQVMSNRQLLLSELCGRRERWEPIEAQYKLAEVYRSFTHREIIAISQPTHDLPESLPSVPDHQRLAMRDGLRKVTESLGEGYGIDYAWKNAAKQLELGLHPNRALSISRGLGL